MERDDLSELHYIAPIENLASILDRGLLSNNAMAKLKLKHRSVAAPEIQARREKKVPGGKPLHDYVNLYVNARNKMMFRVVKNHDPREIMVVGVSCNVLDLPGVVITDRNAAASESYVKFSKSPEGLKYLDHEYVFADYWTHPDDPVEQLRHGSAMCAEVLVPDKVDPKYITRVYVSGPTGRSNASGPAVKGGKTVVILPRLFFQG